MLSKLKNAWKSMVIWFNSLMAVLIAALPAIQEALPAIQQYVPDIKYFAVSVILGNIVLRFKTAKPLEEK